jgi:hypothetical protein
MYLAILIGIALAAAALVGIRRFPLRFRLAIAAVFVILGLVPLVLVVVVGDKPVPGDQVVAPQGNSK